MPYSLIFHLRENDRQTPTDTSTTAGSTSLQMKTHSTRCLLGSFRMYTLGTALACLVCIFSLRQNVSAGRLNEPLLPNVDEVFISPTSGFSSRRVERSLAPCWRVLGAWPQIATNFSFWVFFFRMQVSKQTSFQFNYRIPWREKVPKISNGSHSFAGPLPASEALL